MRVMKHNTEKLIVSISLHIGYTNIHNLFLDIDNNYSNTSPTSSGTHSTSITVPLGISSPFHSLRGGEKVG